MLIFVVGLAACRVLTSGVGNPGGVVTLQDAGAASDARSEAAPLEASAALDVGEPPGVSGLPAQVGCADGTREGFRDVANWPDIAGCAGSFDQPGVIASPELLPVCGNQAGDTNQDNPAGRGCNAADLCAPGWHICRDGPDVARHSSTGGCEGCVPAGEPRFFLVASGAAVSTPSEGVDADPGSVPSSMGICVPVPDATNDLHGCGGLGQPESPACAPLSRRMSFADCLATEGVWWCGREADHLREALVVVKTGPSQGGALCCRN